MQNLQQIKENLDLYIDDYNKPPIQTEPEPRVLFQISTEEEIDEYITENKEKETFPIMLNRLREERNLTPKDLYTKAWIDRRLYSQIMGERNYNPAKNTAIAFGLALNLDFYEMDELLESAGLSLNKSQEFDLVICYCLEKKIYDISTVNELLYHRKLSLLR